MWKLNRLNKKDFDFIPGGIQEALPEGYETKVFESSLCVFAKKTTKNKYICSKDAPKNIYKAPGNGEAFDMMILCAGCGKREEFAKLNNIDELLSDKQTKINALRIELTAFKSKLSIYQASINEQYYQDQIQKLQEETENQIQKLQEETEEIKRHYHAKINLDNSKLSDSNLQIQNLQEKIEILSVDRGLLLLIKSFKHSTSSYCSRYHETLSLFDCLNSLVDKKCTLKECYNKENLEKKLSQIYGFLEKALK